MTVVSIPQWELTKGWWKEPQKLLVYIEKNMYNDSKCVYKSSICCKSWFFACLKSKIQQNWKIWPFFKSAHQAHSKNAKTFEESLFFEEILPRKPF